VERKTLVNKCIGNHPSKQKHSKAIISKQSKASSSGLRERTIQQTKNRDEEQRGGAWTGGWVASDLREREREREREFLDSTLPSLLGLCWKVLPQIERDG
jgi:hypothetical protein